MATDPTTTKEIEKKVSFNENDLSEKNKGYFQFVKDRILELQASRQNVYDINLEEVWKDADRDYIPHKLKSPGKKVIATDEEKGWRGSVVTLGKEDDWQFDGSRPNPYIKINTALAILVDRNPTGVFTPAGKTFEKTNNLIKQLYTRNWEIAKSKQQLKLFIFDLAKYGWAVARTFPMKISRTVKVIEEYNEDEPDKSTWTEKEVVEYNDVYREKLDVWNTWIDDMSKPNQTHSLRDWCWRKVYSYDVAEQEFGAYKNWKYVKPGGNTDDKIGIGAKKRYNEKNLVEILFYENRIKDLFMVIANGIPLVIEPLPVADNQGRKRLSLWQSYWTLRNSECPYGVGIYEAIRSDQVGLDRIRDMAIDQLTLSIYKSFFYSGTTALTEAGKIKIAPGVGKQVMNPKDISWLEVPGPGQESWDGVEMFQRDVDNASGITEPLMGEVTGKTAFEIAQAKESALKRLKAPLENICDALEEDGYTTISIMQMIYSIPETIKIVDPLLIEDYLKEIEGDQNLYQRNENGDFIAKVYREIQLNLEEDKNGNLIESKDTRFLRIKPSGLDWDGVISIDAQSILTPSKELSKALDLEMLNIITPLMGSTSQEMMMAQQTGQIIDLDNSTYGKLIKNILKLYEKEPDEWLPDVWINPPEPQPQQLIVPQESLSGGIAQGGLAQGQPTVEGQVQGNIPEPGKGSPTLPQSSQGIAGKLVSKFASMVGGR